MGSAEAFKCFAGEMNGKSGNINNVCSHLYPPGTRVPGSELICIFDSDQVASKEFFMKTVPLFDGGMHANLTCLQTAVLHHTSHANAAMPVYDVVEQSLPLSTVYTGQSQCITSI